MHWHGRGVVHIKDPCTVADPYFKLYPSARWLVQVATAVLLLPLGALLFPPLKHMC